MSTNSEQGTSPGGLTLQQAIEEAHRCLLCHDAPCSSACPGGTNPGKFVRQIRFFNLKGAARTVMGSNPLGGVCTFVCPTEDTCVGACVRTGIDRPIDIDGLQRFAVEYGRSQGVEVMRAGKTLGKRVAIIGAGPAGLTAAAKLAGLGYSVTLFEARDKLGGMLRYGVPEDRLSDAQLDADLQPILDLGVEVRASTRIESENGAVELLNKGYEAVFVAPGLWKPYELQIPGIDAEGVSNAIDFLAGARAEPEKVRPLVDGKSVAVIGGGSVAMDVANTAKHFGATRVYAIALEGMDELPAQQDELTDAFRHGVVIRPQCAVTSVLTEGGHVVGIEGNETEWIEPGKLVPSNARAVGGSEYRLPVGAVIQAIGQGATEAVGGIIAAAKPARLLAVDDAQATSVEAVFAGGDIVRGAGTVIAAVGDGKRAADAIHELLSNAKEVV